MSSPENSVKVIKIYWYCTVDFKRWVAIWVIFAKIGGKRGRQFLERLGSTNHVRLYSKLVLAMIWVDSMHHFSNQLLLSSEIWLFLDQSPILQRIPSILISFPIVITVVVNINGNCCQNDVNKNPHISEKELVGEMVYGINANDGWDKFGVQSDMIGKL